MLEVQVFITVVSTANVQQRIKPNIISGFKFSHREITMDLIVVFLLYSPYHCNKKLEHRILKFFIWLCIQTIVLQYTKTLALILKK